MPPQLHHAEGERFLALARFSGEFDSRSGLALNLQPFNGVWGFGGVLSIRVRTSSRCVFLLGNSTMELPSGFYISVLKRTRYLPYNVNVYLPPEKGPPKPDNEVRLCGPELDIVIPKSDERHTLLGQFMDAWSLLEAVLLRLVAKLLETDRKSAEYVLATLGTKQIIDLLAALASLKMTEGGVKVMVNFLERVGKLNSKRNVLVHGHWVLAATVYIKRGVTVIQTQFQRETTPPDEKTAKVVANPINQKERVKYIFTLRRIAGATRDVSALSEQLNEFYQKIEFSDEWKEQRAK